MLVVDDRQFEALEQSREQRLLREALARLASHPAAAPLGAAGQRALAEDALAFWRTHDFVTDASYHALVALRLEPAYTDPLPPLPRHLLIRPGFAEATRVRQAHDALVRPTSHLVRLDEDLSREFAA